MTVALVVMPVAVLSVGDVANGASSGPRKLPTAERIACLPIRQAPQTVTVPRTGGVTVVISLAAFPSDVTGCPKIRVATGDKVEPVDDSIETTVVSGHSPVGRGFAALAQAPAPTPNPLVTLTIGDDTDAASTMGSTWVVTGTKLKLDPNLRFPNGTYFATLNAEGPNSRAILVPFTARNGVLTVAPGEVTDGRVFPIMIVANSKATLSLYPKGFRPPVRAQGDFELVPPSVVSTTPTIRPVATVAVEPPQGKPIKGTYGLPPPTGIVGFVTWDWKGCQKAPQICSGTREVFMNGTEAVVDVPLGLVGTVSWSHNFTYMGIQTVKVTGCPIDWSVSASFAGGSITFPDYFPWGTPYKGEGCLIVLSTLPKGKQGGYYAVEIYLRGLAVG